MGQDSALARASKAVMPPQNGEGAELPVDGKGVDYWRTRALLAERSIQELSKVASGAEERLEWMREIGETLARRRDQHDAINLLLDRAVRMIDGKLGALYLRSQESPNEIVARTLIGDRIQEIRLPIGEGLAGVCAETKRVINVKDARRDSRWRYAFDDITGVHTGPVICVPLMDSNAQCLGVIQVINKTSGPYFTVEDQEMLTSIASGISLMLENFRYYFEQVQINIELTEARDSLEERLRQLDTLSALQHRLATSLTRLEEVADVIYVTLALLNADCVILTYIDEAETNSYIGVSDEPTHVVETKRCGPLFQHAIDAGAPYITHATEPSWGPIRMKPGMVIQSYLSVPILAKDQLLGLLEIGVRPERQRRFDDSDARLLSLIAGQLARSLVVLRERTRRERDGRVAALGSMLGGVMHDLKTPLTIASGYLQLMERTDDLERRHVYSEAIKKQFADIQEMTGEVVAYARGEIMLFERTVHVSVLGENLIEWLKHEFEGSRPNVEIHVNTRGTLRVDEGKLKRIIFNLARNAKEAMAEKGGVFIVEISRRDELLYICCRDNGPGIPSHLLPQIFQPFVSSRKGARSGLGLSIVKRLAQELGGDIEVRSVVGEGTCFEITVPWKDVPEDDSDD